MANIQAFIWPGVLVGKRKTSASEASLSFLNIIPRSVRLFLCALACEQAFHLGKSREITREQHAKGDASAWGGTRLVRHNSPHSIY